MEDFDKQVVAYYLKISDDDNADARTCKRFGINEETLNHILMADLVETFSS